MDIDYAAEALARDRSYWMARQEVGHGGRNGRLLGFIPSEQEDSLAKFRSEVRLQKERIHKQSSNGSLVLYFYSPNDSDVGFVISACTAHVVRNGV